MRLYAFADEANAMIDGQIAAMRRNGLNGLEIRNVDGTNVSSITPEKAREVRRKMDDAGLAVWSIGSPIGKIRLNDDFQKHLDAFCHTVDIAREMGAENIRLFSFYPQDGVAPDDCRDEVIERLGRFCEAATGSGVDLCHENEKGIYGDNAARCATLLEALPQLKGIFDPANFIQSGQETMAAWTLLAPRVKYLHIKDCLPDGTVVPAGKGVGHLPEILADFIARGGDALTIEPHLRVFSGLAALEREGEKSGIDALAYPTNDAAFDAACTALKALL